MLTLGPTGVGAGRGGGVKALGWVGQSAPLRKFQFSSKQIFLMTMGEWVNPGGALRMLNRNFEASFSRKKRRKQSVSLWPGSPRKPHNAL